MLHHGVYCHVVRLFATPLPEVNTKLKLRYSEQFSSCLFSRSPLGVTGLSLTRPTPHPQTLTVSSLTPCLPPKKRPDTCEENIYYRWKINKNTESPRFSHKQ